MQIHDLNTGTPAATDVLAMDTGSDTYKTTPGNVVPDYTSGDSSTATSWTSVTAVASGLSFSTLIGRITTMMKNVRYLYTILGSSTFSTVASTITGAIGNTALGTTATTLSGAIAEHESDISTLNSKFSYQDVSATTGDTQYAGYYYNNVTYPTDKGDLAAFSVIGASSNRWASAIYVSAGTLRVYSNVAETTVYVRCLFMK